MTSENLQYYIIIISQFTTCFHSSPQLPLFVTFSLDLCIPSIHVFVVMS